jgi:hypothetical protein
VDAAADETGSPATVIEAYMKTETVGNLTVRMELAADAEGGITVNGEFVSDSSQGNEVLQNMSRIKESFQEALEETLGDAYADSDVKFGTTALRYDSETMAAGRGISGGISRSTACRVAVEAVRTMIELCR